MSFTFIFHSFISHSSACSYPKQSSHELTALLLYFISALGGFVGLCLVWVKEVYCWKFEGNVLSGCSSLFEGKVVTRLYDALSSGDHQRHLDHQHLDMCHVSFFCITFYIQYQTWCPHCIHGARSDHNSTLQPKDQEK